MRTRTPHCGGGVLSEEEHRAVRRNARRAGPAFHVKRFTISVAAALSLTVVAVVVAIPYLPAPNPSHGGGMAFHWHPHLSIVIDGQPVTILANIGIDPLLWNDHSLDRYGMQAMPEMGMGAMAPLHTHNTDGTIHLESLVVRDYTLGDFFQIWGQSFDSQQVLGHSAPQGHRVWMVVGGATTSPSYSVVLRDQMQIQIVCGAG